MLKILSLALIGCLLLSAVLIFTANAVPYIIQTQKIDSIGTGGDYCALSLDSKGYPHVSYGDGEQTGLKYAWFNGSKWNSQLVENGGPTGINGLHSTLKLDSSGNPHICYFDVNAQYGLYLRYAYWNGEAWICQTVDPSGEGLHPSLALDSLGNPHITYYGGSSLKYASWDGSQWVTQVIDPGILYNLSIGTYSSLQIDSNDKPHVAYSDETNKLIKYASWDGSHWNIETVESNIQPISSDIYPNSIECSLALDSNNCPSICYLSSEGLKYALHMASGWNIQMVDRSGDPKYAVGTSPSLAIDSNGTPHVSYIDSYRGNVLKYAYLNGSKWLIYGITDSPFSGYSVALALDANNTVHIVHNDYLHTSLEYMHFNPKTLGTPTPVPDPAPIVPPSPSITPKNMPGIPQVLDSGHTTGMYTSIAVDSQNNAHISYFDSIYGLKSAASNGSSWFVEAIDVSGWYGLYTSIALDSHGYPHISYFDNINSSLRYAWWNGNQWIKETVDTGGLGSCTSIVLDSKDYPHISYHAGIKGDLKYAEWDGLSWHIQTVDSNGIIGEFTSIALDSEQKPHISYYDFSKGDLKYASWTGSSWSIQTIDSTGDVGYSTSLKIDSNNNAHISYLDNTQCKLKYAESKASTWIIQTLDSVGNSEAHIPSSSWLNQTSLALDSNSNPHITYFDANSGNLKYAFWNGSAWISQVADSTTSVGLSSALALDSAGRAHISYYDGSNRNLRYIESVNASGFPAYQQVLSYQTTTITIPTPTTTVTPQPTQPTVTPAPTTFTTLTPTPNPNKQPTSITLTCFSQNSTHTLNVRASGELTSNEQGISNADIIISYSNDSGVTWRQFPVAKTDSTGQFSAETILPAIGSYLIKAAWEGDQTHQSTAKNVTFALSPVIDQNILAITSNSTVSQVAFNSTSKTLSFSVNGTTGTVGYVNFTIAKSVIDNTMDLHVYLDDKELPFIVQSQGFQWLISFTYHHSSHRVDIQLATTPASVETGLFDYRIIVGLILVIAVSATATILVFRKKLKH